MTDVQSIRGLAAVPLAQIRTAENVRERLTNIDELAASIKAHGVMQPIAVQRDPMGGYVVIHGHRRLAASRKAGRDSIPALILGDLMPDQRLVRQLAENSQRVQLDPIEEARAFKRCRDLGMTAEQVAIVAGVSAATVASRIALLKLPRADQDRLRAGDMTLGQAAAIASLIRERKAGTVRHGREKPYLAKSHPLAAGIDCPHDTRPRVGGVGCGSCWEDAIRADERAKTAPLASWDEAS